MLPNSVYLAQYFLPIAFFNLCQEYLEESIKIYVNFCSRTNVNVVE